MVDVNGLKLINDVFGYIVGDRFLVSILKILKRKCCKNDIVVWIGGDEFVILLFNIDVEDVRSIINCIYEVIMNEDIENIVLLVLMGFVVKKDVFDDVYDVFKKVEDNMYKYKFFKSENMKKKIIDCVIEKLYKNKIEV